MHSVEERYFNEAIELFRDAKVNFELFHKRREFQASNIINLYTLPSLSDAYYSQEELLNLLFPQNNKSKEEFFKLLYEILQSYQATGKIKSKKLKKILSQFFSDLANAFEVPFSIEKEEATYSNREYAYIF